MIISRGELLAKLHEADAGLSKSEELEQSDCYVFFEGQLITFNDSVAVRTASPLDFDAAVQAASLRGVLAKMPDESVEITFDGSEVRLKGKNRSAGIIAQAEINLPTQAIPDPEKWSKLGEGIGKHLQNAAKTCGDEDGEPATQCVHVTKDCIEASDNFRLLRIDEPTGFPSECLIPASAMLALANVEIKKVSITDGWVHFRTSAKSTISLRTSAETYPDDVEGILTLDNPENVVLPTNLAEIVERLDPFIDEASKGTSSKLNVRLAAGKVVFKSQNANGWFREKKNIDYSGRPLSFEVDPVFLVDVLKRTREVQVDEGKMLLKVGSTRFAVFLTTTEEE